MAECEGPTGLQFAAWHKVDRGREWREDLEVLRIRAVERQKKGANRKNKKSFC